MKRRAFGVTLVLLAVAALGLSLADGDDVQAYPSVEALGQDIDAHGPFEPRCLFHAPRASAV